MATPLTKTYSKTHPYVVQRDDREDGSIVYEIWDERPDTYRCVCKVSEDYVEAEADPDYNRGQAKTDADMIARALNLMNGGLPADYHDD